MGSNKFARGPLIQPLPPLCHKSPKPSEMFDQPLPFRWLQAYASWHEPGTPNEVFVSGTANLEPDPVNDRWIGRTRGDDAWLVIILSLEPPATTYRLTVTLNFPDQAPDSLTVSPVPLRSEEPFATIDVNMAPLSQAQTVQAQVLA